MTDTSMPNAFLASKEWNDFLATVKSTEDQAYKDFGFMLFQDIKKQKYADLVRYVKMVLAANQQNKTGGSVPKIGVDNWHTVLIMIKKLKDLVPSVRNESVGSEDVFEGLISSVENYVAEEEFLVMVKKMVAVK